MNGLHISGNEVYQRDIATLKKYREGYYKITLHKQLRRAGYEAIEGDSDGKRKTGKKDTAENEEKLSASLSRTRAAIFELALCNDWEGGLFFLPWKGRCRTFRGWGWCYPALPLDGGYNPRDGPL